MRISPTFPRTCRVLALGCVVALAGWASTVPTPVQGRDSDTARPTVDFHNNSDRCAWVTVYWSYKTHPGWYILDQAGNRPRFVEKGRSWSFWTQYNTPILGPQMKFMAEIMKTDSCHSGNAGPRPETKTDVQKYGSSQIRATLEGSNGGYHIAVSSH